MSKKTQQIYKSIENLSKMQQKIGELAKNLNDENMQTDVLYRTLDEISFQMQQNLKNLDFWFKSLYFYNGKSTSTAKKQASKENGKKGGRPPKEIAQAKQELADAENRIFQIEENLKMNDNTNEINQLQNEQKILEKSKIEYLKILQDYENKINRSNAEF